MKYIQQFAIILAFTLAGEALHYFIPLPIPASIYGLLLLFAALESKLLPLSLIEEAGDFLLEIMPLMFVPAAVGLMDIWNLLLPDLAAYLTITVVSFAVVLAASGGTAQLMLNGSRKEAKK